MKGHEINIALVCTRGGHFEQMPNLSDFYNRYDDFWITNKHAQTLGALTNERKYFVIPGDNKTPWTYLSQIPIRNPRYQSRR